MCLEHIMAVDANMCSTGRSLSTIRTMMMTWPKLASLLAVASHQVGASVKLSATVVELAGLFVFLRRI